MAKQNFLGITPRSSDFAISATTDPPSHYVISAAYSESSHPGGLGLDLIDALRNLNDIRQLLKLDPVEWAPDFGSPATAETPHMMVTVPPSPSVVTLCEAIDATRAAGEVPAWSWRTMPKSIAEWNTAVASRDWRHAQSLLHPIELDCAIGRLTVIGEGVWQGEEWALSFRQAPVTEAEANAGKHCYQWPNRNVKRIQTIGDSLYYQLGAFEFHRRGWIGTSVNERSEGYPDRAGIYRKGNINLRNASNPAMPIDQPVPGVDDYVKRHEPKANSCRYNPTSEAPYLYDGEIGVIVYRNRGDVNATTTELFERRFASSWQMKSFSDIGGTKTDLFGEIKSTVNTNIVDTTIATLESGSLWGPFPDENPNHSHKKPADIFTDSTSFPLVTGVKWRTSNNNPMRDIDAVWYESATYENNINRLTLNYETALSRLNLAETELIGAPRKYVWAWPEAINPQSFNSHKLLHRKLWMKRIEAARFLVESHDSTIPSWYSGNSIHSLNMWGEIHTLDSVYEATVNIIGQSNFATWLYWTDDAGGQIYEECVPRYTGYDASKYPGIGGAS